MAPFGLIPTHPYSFTPGTCTSNTLLGNSGGVLLQSQDLGVTHTTYTDAVGSCLPTTHLSILTRTWVKEKQVLVNMDPLSGTSHLQELNKHELVAKANKALTMMMTHLTVTSHNTLLEMLTNPGHFWLY